MVEYLKTQDSNSESYQNLLEIYEKNHDKDYVFISYEERLQPELAIKVHLYVLRKEAIKLNLSEKEKT